METASNSPFWAVITSILYYANLDADLPWEWIITDDNQRPKGEILDNMRVGLVSCFYHRDDLENIDICIVFGYDHVIIDYNLELLCEFRQVLLPGGIVLFVRVLP